MRRFYGTDNIAFTFVSDEYNGQTRDHNGNLRPSAAQFLEFLTGGGGERSGPKLLGIHWTFDKTQGIALGRRVADHGSIMPARPLP